MTSFAPSFRPPLTPPATKKRGIAEPSPESGRQLKKRLQPLNLPPRFSGSVFKTSMPTPRPATQSTGLEDYLKLDVDFVEATKATEEDEAKRSVQVSSDSRYRALLFERRHLVSGKLTRIELSY
jgi:hypothetical protein